MIYEKLAARIMLGEKKKFDLSNYGLIFRKNRTIKDVEKAVIRAYKNGNHKTENEIGMLAVYLHGIFKKETPRS